MELFNGLEPSTSSITKLMSDYSNADIAYSTIMAQEAELIKAHIIDAGNCFNECIYFSLTYKGHKFLENVKNNKIWTQTKNIVGKVGSISLDIISTIASKVLQDLITKQLQF